MRRPCPPLRQREFLPDGSNLPHVIHTLAADHPESHERWVEHVSEALPDVAQVTTRERPEDRHRYLVLHYRSGLEAPSWLVSDGTLRLLALTLLAYLQDLTGLFLIEEPENGIHPRALETVLQSLSSVYRAQILLATHSPLVVRLADRDQLLCLARTEQGATDIVAGTEHPVLRDWQGTADLGTLLAGGVLGSSIFSASSPTRTWRLRSPDCWIAPSRSVSEGSSGRSSSTTAAIRAASTTAAIRAASTTAAIRAAPRPIRAAPRCTGLLTTIRTASTTTDYSRRSGLLTTHRTTCGAIAPGQSTRW